MIYVLVLVLGIAAGYLGGKYLSKNIATVEADVKAEVTKLDSKL